MRLILKTTALVAGALLAGAAFGAGLPADTADPISLAQQQISAYLAQLGDLHCTETVTQDKLSANGHVMDSEHDQYDYLIMMSGSADDFSLNESRASGKEARHKVLNVPMLVTNGMSTALLVFHPYYRSGFEFETGAEEAVDGRPAIPIHFRHIAGRRTPIALALRGREFPLDMEGTAWLDEGTKQIVKVEANLEHDMSDVGLKSLSIRVEYKPQLVGGRTSTISLPSLAVVEVDTPRQRWRNTHRFSDYKSFSTNVEQDPGFKIHPDQTPTGSNQVTPSPHGGPK